MTLLEAVNEVLCRLREDEVGSINETDYSNMVAALVNDAVDIVQTAHKWSHQFTEIDLTTVASTQEYTLDGVGGMGKVYHAFNDTSNYSMPQRTRGWMNVQSNLGSGSSEGAPKFWSFSAVAADDDPLVKVWPIPDGVYTLTFNVQKQQPVPITSGGTELEVPGRPVVALAHAFAVKERGETGGNSDDLLQKAQQILGDYIAIDAERNPDIVTWFVE